MLNYSVAELRYNRLIGLFTSPFFVLFQVEVCINLILWDWPNFILRTSVRTGVISHTVCFIFFIHTFNGIFLLGIFLVSHYFF